MKIHLGCGENYLKGYVNIDFPPTKHTVQNKNIADLHANIQSLQYKSESVEEIRLHHVFEHFTRPIACALLVSWRSWLKKGGILRIEVPDFDRTARSILNPFLSSKKKAVALRHIFGSNEAPWAVHYEGWSANRLTKILSSLGFNIQEIKRNSWKGTYNVEIIARRNNLKIEKEELEKRVKEFFSNFLIDNSSSEKELLEVWIKEYKLQVEKSSIIGDH